MIGLKKCRMGELTHLNLSKNKLKNKGMKHLAKVNLFKLIVLKL